MRPTYDVEALTLGFQADRKIDAAYVAMVRNRRIEKKRNAASMSGGPSSAFATSPVRLRAGVVGDEDQVGQNSLEDWLEADPTEAKTSLESGMICAIQLLAEIRDVSRTDFTPRSTRTNLDFHPLEHRT